MVNVKEFLLKRNIGLGTYALITYNNKIEPTYFTKYNFGEGDWFLESPCQLSKFEEIKEPIDDYLKTYTEDVLDMLEDEEDTKQYIEEFIKPMIIDNVLYDIANFQCSPYLPEDVDDIKLISARECLEY